MAGVPGGGFKPARVRADDDLYTVLTIIAFGFVLLTFIFVVYRNVGLFGTPFPGFG